MDDSTRQQLIQLARGTIEARLRGTPLPLLPEIEAASADFGGAFVTLHNHGALRGCIGQFLPKSSLCETVQQMALASLEDPRFTSNPVTADELPEIDIEISILSPMQRTRDPLSLQVGVHGIYIRSGHRAGTFLPQVAPEQGWDAREFLSFCCAHKAGLPPNAWQDPQTEVYFYTAELIHEK